MNLYNNYKDLKMYISNNGAYIESLSDKGQNIIFPLTEIKLEDGTTKIRGGNHSCLPNFGIDDSYKLKAHGFGRSLIWEPVNKDEAVTHLFLRGIDEYSNLFTDLIYELKDNSLFMKLSLVNRGSTCLPIAPGFHPYIYSENSYIKVEGNEFTKEELIDTVFLKRNELKFETNKFKFEYECKNVNTFAVWTDFMDDYICVEPTYNGPSFKNNSSSKPYELKPNESFELEAVLKWEPK